MEAIGIWFIAWVFCLAQLDETYSFRTYLFMAFSFVAVCVIGYNIGQELFG